jgi:hypothetical protein
MKGLSRLVAELKLDDQIAAVDLLKLGAHWEAYRCLDIEASLVNGARGRWWQP